MIEFKITDEEVFNRRPFLPLDIKDRWLTALKSGDYPKGKEYLNRDGKFCCLGVAAELQEDLAKRSSLQNQAYYYNGFCTSLPHESIFYPFLKALGELRGFKISGFSCLAEINDNTETFEEVIETIEKYF